jgi:hypothetical protein
MLEQARVNRQPKWRTSSDVCAFTDGERHLGHVVRTDGLWWAFDATSMDDERKSFRLLGSFCSFGAAKETVEQAISPSRL